MQQCPYLATFENKQGRFYCCSKEFSLMGKTTLRKYNQTDIQSKCALCKDVI
jgi:hypothetical protein